MNLFHYLRERWLSLLFLFFALLFTAMVYRLDIGFNIRESNANYILMGWGLLFAAYLIIDFSILNSRSRKFQTYCQLNVFSEGEDEFFYPIDRQNAELVRKVAEEYEQYKSNIESKSAEEMEFITRWLHDVKVPIAAARLILESQEEKLPTDFYQNIYREIFSIEESILQVFYEMKSNRFFDDYKIARTNTKKLIARALKGYSNFFSYKKLRITVEGEDYEVLTDEKWSSYILSQIISNAVKYSPDNGSIEVVTKKNGKEITISIKNKGKGIPERDIGQIFNKGFTSSDSRDGAKSTGYGLYLSKKLSRLLGHSLTAESKYHEYAIFHLSFSENNTLHNVTKM